MPRRVVVVVVGWGSRNDHFLCEDEECLAKKFTVFGSEPELRAHAAKAHMSNAPRSQRQVPAARGATV